MCVCVWGGGGGGGENSKASPPLCMNPWLTLERCYSYYPMLEAFMVFLSRVVSATEFFMEISG